MRLRYVARRTLRRFIFDHERARYHFIHIPKNGGVSVREALFLQRDVSLSHPYHYRFVDIADRVGRHLRFFAVIRNPWSRTASRFHFGKQSANKWPADDPRRSFLTKATFADFVKEQPILPIPNHPGQPWMGPLNSWFNQLEWLRNERGAVVCDCLRTEQLEDDLSAYLKRAIRVRLQNVAKTRYDYRSMYTDELAAIVASLFREDIDYFGFSFDGPATKNIFVST